MVAVLVEDKEAYVKFIVHNPNPTEYTYRIVDGVADGGWTPIEETIRFDEALNDSLIQIQIWHHNEHANEEQLYEESTTLSSMTDRVIYENSTIKTNSKLFMVSIWRDNFVYDDLSFKSNVFNVEDLE